MQDLIDRNALIEKLKQTKFPCVLPSGIDYLEGIQTAITRITGIINDTVQVEAEPVRHGRWVYDETIGGMKHYCCTSCKECNPGSECFADENQILWFAFCPKCGARMDGGAS